MAYKPPATPYCGFDRDDDNRRVLAESAAHVLVSGPTGRGKTRRILAPAAVLWGGPAVVVSSKDDLFQLVMERRYGPKALIDLRPDYDADYPGVDMMSFDPTKLISTPDQAVTAANTMMQMSAVGLGSGIDQVSDGGIWESNTEGPLAAMLYAASPKGNNAGIEWVLLAVDNMHLEDPNSQMSLEPGWQMAADIVSNMPLFHNALMRTLFMDHRQRDSIALTMRKAVMPWMRLALRGITHRPFDESFLSDPEATLYVLSPPEGSIAGAAVTLLEHLVKVWRAKTARREMRYRLLYVIDEATNVAPMPALRRHVGEGRGLGVNFLVAVQASSQFDTVYGSAYAHELRDIFPAALIMYGAAEMDMLRRAEEWSLQTTRRQESFDQASGAKMLSSQLGSTLDYRRLMPPNDEHARLWMRGTEASRPKSLSGRSSSSSTTGLCSELCVVSGRSARQRICGTGSPNATGGRWRPSETGGDEHVSQQAAGHILAVLAAAVRPVSITDVRNEVNAHVGLRVVAEQVYKALRGLREQQAPETPTGTAPTKSSRRAEMAVIADERILPPRPTRVCAPLGVQPEAIPNTPRACRAHAGAQVWRCGQHCFSIASSYPSARTGGLRCAERWW